MKIIAMLTPLAAMRIVARVLRLPQVLDEVDYMPDCAKHLGKILFPIRFAGGSDALVQIVFGIPVRIVLTRPVLRLQSPSE